MNTMNEIIKKYEGKFRDLSLIRIFFEKKVKDVSEKKFYLNRFFIDDENITEKNYPFLYLKIKKVISKNECSEFMKLIGYNIKVHKSTTVAFCEKVLDLEKINSKFLYNQLKQQNKEELFKIVSNFHFFLSILENQNIIEVRNNNTNNEFDYFLKMFLEFEIKNLKRIISLLNDETEEKNLAKDLIEELKNYLNENNIFEKNEEMILKIF